MLAQGKAAVEAGLCCPTAYITELTLLIAFLSQLCAAARVCPTRTADVRGGKPPQHGPTCRSHTAKTETPPEPGQHPTLHLHTPTFAVGAPTSNGGLPQEQYTSRAAHYRPQFHETLG